VPLSPQYSTHVNNFGQVLAKDSAPVARSERCSGNACTPGHFWVGLVLQTVGSPHRHPRFIGLSGGYFSLQYLSLSDATVLTFLAPILTAFSGAIFLKETLSLKDMCAGCMSSQVISPVVAIHRVLVCSFFGVILVARPRSLFGSPKGELFEAVMPWQRMLSVVLGVPQVLSRCLLSYHFLALRSSVSWERLVPVSQRFSHLDSCTYLLSHRHLPPCNWKTGPFASFPFIFLLTISHIFYNWVCSSLPVGGTFDAIHLSMIAFKIPPVIPTRVLWFAMLFLIGILGLIALVRLLPSFLSDLNSRRHS
jgi:hypothetical protein